MSSLTQAERRYLEKLFGMESGWVLDYNDATYGEFFRSYEIDIHSDAYQTHGTSKAKKMRAFWDQAEDSLVATVLKDMLDLYEANCIINGKPIDKVALNKAQTAILRLQSVSGTERAVFDNEDFLHREFSIPDIRKLPIEPMTVPIIESRLSEIRVTMESGAYLSSIFMCGSVLEGVLLGVAQNKPGDFNKALASPKNREKKVKPFHEWNLSQLIDVACEVGVLKPDVKKFSHGLRDFRNYIHPYEQMASRFTPDQHTAKVCLQVLKAALASIAGER